MLKTDGAGPYPFPTLPGAVRQCVVVAIAVLVCLASRVSPIIDDGGLFLIFGITVLGAAWLAGTGAALVTTLAGAIVGYVEAPPTVAVETHLALFIVQGLLLTAIVAELRRARRAAERDAHIAMVARLDTEAANRMKDEFLATISHELRTPLNAVLGWLHLIRTGKLDEGTEDRGLESIERNVRLQAQFTADLLDISKALTGKLHLDSRPVSLTAAIHEAVSQVATPVSAKAVRLDVSLPDGPVVVRGDANRLRQVAWHLLANAIKFTPRGGRIVVRLETNSHACLTVRDNGPGIDPDFLPRIFDRFTQADASPTKSAGGLGMGLSLVRELVERHGGEIEARNAGDGHGAVFVVRLPLHVEDQRQPALVPPPMVATAMPPLDGVRVLVLEADQDSRDALETVLRRRGATVRAASSIGEALEALETWRPDVLVSDAVSTDHDAYAIVGKVESLEAEHGGRIPAAALTRAAGLDGQLRRLISAVHRQLPRPVDPVSLAAEVGRLAGRERRQARR